VRSNNSEEEEEEDEDVGGAKLNWIFNYRLKLKNDI
jgi:hypothetical protein